MKRMFFLFSIFFMSCVAIEAMDKGVITVYNQSAHTVYVQLFDIKLLVKKEYFVKFGEIKEILPGRGIKIDWPKGFSLKHLLMYSPDKKTLEAHIESSKTMSKGDFKIKISSEFAHEVKKGKSYYLIGKNNKLTMKGGVPDTADLQAAKDIAEIHEAAIEEGMPIPPAPEVEEELTGARKIGVVAQKKTKDFAEAFRHGLDQIKARGRKVVNVVGGEVKKSSQRLKKVLRPADEEDNQNKFENPIENRGQLSRPVLIVNGYEKTCYVRVYSKKGNQFVAVNKDAKPIKLLTKRYTWLDGPEKYFFWWRAQDERVLVCTTEEFDLLNKDTITQEAMNEEKNIVMHKIVANTIVHLTEVPYQYRIGKVKVIEVISGKEGSDLDNKNVYAAIYLKPKTEEDFYVLGSQIQKLETTFDQGILSTLNLLYEPQEAGIRSWFGYGSKKVLVVAEQKNLLKPKIEFQKFSFGVGQKELSRRTDKYVPRLLKDKTIKLYTKKGFERRDVQEEPGWFDKLAGWVYDKARSAAAKKLAEPRK